MSAGTLDPGAYEQVFVQEILAAHAAHGHSIGGSPVQLVGRLASYDFLTNTATLTDPGRPEGIAVALDATGPFPGTPGSLWQVFGNVEILRGVCQIKAIIIKSFEGLDAALYRDAAKVTRAVLRRQGLLPRILAG